MTEVANATRRTAEHAGEEYAWALASLGALAFTETDFAEARVQYGLAMTLPGLSAERLAPYQHAYRVASTAVAARTRDEQQARAITKKMKDKGIAPNEITVTTAIKKVGSFAAALGLIDDCLTKRWFVGHGSFEAAYSWPIGHLAADELLTAYHARPFNFDTALEGPINQYRKARRLGEALKLVEVAPNVGAAQKL